MFFHYFGLITFTIIVAIALAIFVVSCCKGHYLYYQFTKPQLRAYDNKLQYYRIDCDKDKSKWVPLRCTIMRKYHPHGDENKIAHQGESKSIFESGDTYEEYAQKNNIENSVVVFDKFQEQIDSITNEHDKDILDIMNSSLSSRGMFLTNGKGLILHPREECYFRCTNTLVHTITKLMKDISYTGFKYNKGLFRSGNMLVTSKDIVGWKEYTRGTMYVTNQRVVIIGIDNKVKSIPLGQIISYSNYENNGVLFQIANGNPLIFNLPCDGMFHFNTVVGTLYEDDLYPCLLALDKAFEERNK